MKDIDKIRDDYQRRQQQDGDVAILVMEWVEQLSGDSTKTVVNIFGNVERLEEYMNHRNSRDLHGQFVSLRSVQH